MTRYVIQVFYRGRQLSRQTVNRQMVDADPAGWDLDHPLMWSCPVMAQYGRDNIAWTFGSKYQVQLVTVK